MDSAGRIVLRGRARGAGARGACSMAKLKRMPSSAKDAPHVGSANKAMLVRFAVHLVHANARTRVILGRWLQCARWGAHRVRLGS